MGDEDCVRFLQWALPKLGMRWRGFRRVRRQVCRRIRLRMRALELEDHASYRAHLEQHPDEWPRLDAMCRVTISRFFRDRRLYEELPAMASAVAGTDQLRIWCAGCASGEEPYSVALALGDIELRTEIVATDADPAMLDRARRGIYQQGTLRELDEDVIAAAFDPVSDGYRLRAEVRSQVTFIAQDVREAAPPGLFHLIFCRNLAFTYFDRDTQLAVLERFAGASCERGALLVGAHETLPEGGHDYMRWADYHFAYLLAPCQAAAADA